MVMLGGRRVSILIMEPLTPPPRAREVGVFKCVVRELHRNCLYIKTNAAIQDTWQQYNQLMFGCEKQIYKNYLVSDITD